MSTDLATLKQNAPAPTEPKKKATDFPQMLNAYKGEIARALPQHMSGDRLARIALTEFRRNPKLGDCDPRSVFAAVIQASQLGLEPGVRGRAFLVPYKGECTFVPGWMGLVDLMNRTGRATVWTGAVFEGDEFDYTLGDAPFVKHKPAGNFEPEQMTHAYAVGKVNGAQQAVIEVWPNARLLRHRDRYNKVGKGHYSYGNWEMYARKVVMLQVLKYMPASVELEQAIALSYAADLGGQGLTVRDAIDGTWSAPAPPAPEYIENKQDAPPAGAKEKQPQTPELD